MMSVAFDKDSIPEELQELLFPGKKGEIVDLVVYNVHLIYATESSLEGIEVEDIGPGKIAVTVPNPFVATGTSLLFAAFNYDSEADEIGGIIEVAPAAGNTLTFTITGDLFGEIWIIAFAEEAGGETFIFGDVNADGKVDGADAVLLLRKIANDTLGASFNLPANFCLFAADVNDDGKIDGADAVLLLRYIANETLGASFPNTGKAGQTGTK
jgi:hypothetical protein